jgi:hypothetical protein
MQLLLYYYHYYNFYNIITFESNYYCISSLTTFVSLLRIAITMYYWHYSSPQLGDAAASAPPRDGATCLLVKGGAAAVRTALRCALSFCGRSKRP